MKLLFSEYCDFEDMVLIESPFAQTTREGRGLRQVHLGLTPSKLVLATDVLPPVEKSCINFLPGIDPDIETFELIAIYPIDCVNLSVFRRRKRQTIKAHFCNNRVFYFELGGFENRTMFWNLWCEKVKFLSPESGSSLSETSVATSSTNSTLYLIDSKQVVKPNGLTQVWCKFGTGKEQSSSLVPKWTDRYLYLGKSFEDNFNYKPIVCSPRMSQFLHSRKITNFSIAVKSQPSQINEIHIGDSYHVNRFESGIREGCKSALFLPAEDYIFPMKWNQSTERSSIFCEDFDPSSHALTLDIMAEDCIKLWESNANKYNIRHRRRFGIVPQPLLLHGLGPWNMTPGAKYSIQVKRAVSVVTIRRQPAESELRLPVPKRQLVATISCEALEHDKLKHNSQTVCGSTRRPVIFFWTPEYWYRPISARDAYQELKNHLSKINRYHQKYKKKRRLFRRRPPIKPSSSDTDSDISNNTARYRKVKKRRSMMRFNVFGGSSNDISLCCLMTCTDQEKTCKETSLQYLKRLLKVNVVLTAWDFNSTTLAQQLTMIDRDLFLKISGIELTVLISQQSSKNAPNVAAMVAFSHRISCLVASDILKNQCDRMRARLIARFITVAEKCNRISNFQSCRTILFGLQSPAIYRLKTTWAYVRKKHASKYQTFEFLCRLYKDPRLLSYQRAFFFASQTDPYLPFVGHIVAKLLNRIPEYKIIQNTTRSPKLAEGLHKDNNGLLSKLLMSMRLMNFQENSNSRINNSSFKKPLCYHYQPLDCYEDNRIECLIKTTEFLQQCQLSALHYSFTRNTLAVDYLLKARYREERDNFYQSCRVEPVE